MDEERRNIMPDVPERPDYEKELAAIIRSRRPDSVIREELDNYHENDIAAVLEELTPQERKRA